MRPVSKRVLVFMIVSLAIAAIAGAWFHRLFSGSTPEERARDEAAHIQQRVRQMTR